jgi:hypothetical protein
MFYYFIFHFYEKRKSIKKGALKSMDPKGGTLKIWHLLEIGNNLRAANFLLCAYSAVS